MTAVRSLAHSCVKKDKLRFITFLTDKFYDELLSETGHEFYYWDHDNNIDPKTIPYNFFPIKEMDLPIHLDVDAVICQDYGMQYKISKKFADFWHLPIIMVFHYIKSDNQFLISGDINIYDSYEIQESWNYPGAVIIPGVDENFCEININKDSKILLCDIKTEEEVIICREIITGTPFTINSLNKDKYARLEQYKNARGLIQLKPKQFPIEVLEAYKVGLPIISVGNSNVKGYNSGVYSSPLQIKAAIMSLDLLKNSESTVRTYNDFVKDFNNTIEFIHNFIYIRG